jgi:DNA-binding response OmpR family regulator
MKPKAHILIVEDKAILYKRLSMALSEENYSVDGFTPSVEKALERIQNKIPDIALLDIDLEGEQTGIDLGKILSTSYNIPFIYVTDYDDNETFFEGLKTKHDNFLVKTKPHLDTQQVVRAIQTALQRNKNEKSLHTKEALLCFTDYIENIKEQGTNQISQVPLPYSNIALITTNSTKLNESKTKLKNRPCYVKLRTNYTRLETWDKDSYYLPSSLSELVGKLPITFIRINESEIVNLSHPVLQGRINGSRLKIGDHICHISKTYKPEVEKRFELLYQKFR